MMWTSKDGPKFTLDLMTKMFSKEQLAGQICFSSKARPSLRTLLPRDKVKPVAILTVF